LEAEPKKMDRSVYHCARGRWGVIETDDTNGHDESIKTCDYCADPDFEWIGPSTCQVAVSTAATRALELCSEPVTRAGPVLYEYAALTMEGEDYDPGPTQTTLLERVRTALSARSARSAGSGRTVISQCHRSDCPDHTCGMVTEPPLLSALTDLSDLTDRQDREDLAGPLGRTRKRPVNTPVRSHSASKRHRP
jgi:hypothetical protein